MNNGDSPKIVITFAPNGDMQMESNVPLAAMTLAALFIEAQVLAALAPKPAGPQIVVPRVQFPPPVQGV